VVEDLVRVDALLRRRHLAAEDEHGRALLLRPGDAGKRIREPRSERRDQHGRRAGELVHRVGHEGGRRLALRQHELDARLLAGADRLQHVVPGNAEGEADAVGLQRARDEVGDRHGATVHHSISLA
jgi:hypothetical protein